MGHTLKELLTNHFQLFHPLKVNVHIIVGNKSFLVTKNLSEIDIM